MFYPLPGSLPRDTDLPFFCTLVAVRPVPEFPQLLARLGAQDGLHRLFDGLTAPIGPGLRLAHQDLVGHLGDGLIVAHRALPFLAETFLLGTWEKPSANFAPRKSSEVLTWGPGSDAPLCDPRLLPRGAAPPGARTPRCSASCSGARATPAAPARTRAPSASPRVPPAPGPARSACPPGAAPRTRSRRSRSPGGPQACARLRRRWRVRPPSRRRGSWGCTSTSLCPPFPKGRWPICTRCYEHKTATGGSGCPLGVLIHRSAWKDHSPNFVLRGFCEVRIRIVHPRMHCYYGCLSK